MNDSTIVSNIYQTVNFADAIFSIASASIVIYLFVTKRNAISSIYHLLINYTLQNSLKELDTKLDKLNEYNADEPQHKEYVVIILNEINGQMKGNPILKLKCKPMLKELSMYIERPQSLTEARKRGLVSELRETLKHINIQNYDELLGEKHE